MAQMEQQFPFGSNLHYEEKGVDDGAYQEQWADFERRLLQETRFFSRFGIEILTATFTGVHEHKTRDKRAAVVSAGPGGSILSLFRARVFQSDNKLEASVEVP